MIRNETRLMESAIALAEELHFSRAARKVGISQPMLTKNIQDLEFLLGGPLFIRDRRNVELSDAGRAYIEQARLSLLYGERAVQAARATMRDLDISLHVGRTPYADPFFVTALLAIRLPLFPKLKIELSSHYSVELAHELMAGTLDLAIANEPPESAQLTRVKIAESPYYIALAKDHALARFQSLSLSMLGQQRWILYERRLHPPCYDAILKAAERQRVVPTSISNVTSPEEAFPFVADGSSIAFVVKAGALLIARSGVTVRPLLDEDLQLRTFLVSRADNESRIASEFVRTYMRKVSSVNSVTQLKLPIQG